MTYKRIEFMGLPGAGKTTSVRCFLKAASELNLQIQVSSSVCRQALIARDDGLIGNLLKKLPALIWEPLCGAQKTTNELHRFFFNHAELMAAVLQGICDLELNDAFRECILYDFFRCGINHQLTDDHLAQGEAVLFEEGFGQIGCLLAGYVPNGFVPQEMLLLHDTVMANVTLGDPELSREAVERVLRETDAWSFVAKMPQGLDTLVGERGARLSGGQRQRISMARALVREPDLLILDEATASLDPETEASLCRTLKALSRRTTIAAISHQQAVAEAADRVYEVRNTGVRLVRESEGKP